MQDSYESAGGGLFLQCPTAAGLNVKTTLTNHHCIETQIHSHIIREQRAPDTTDYIDIRDDQLHVRSSSLTARQHPQRTAHSTASAARTSHGTAAALPSPTWRGREANRAWNQPVTRSAPACQPQRPADD